MPATPAIPPFSPLVTDAAYGNFNLQVRRSPGVVVSCVGRERCLPSYRVERPGYACYGLEFVAEGEGTLTLAGKRYRLQPGHLFLYGPGVPHLIESDAGRPMKKYFVDFFGLGSTAWFHREGLRPGRLVQVLEIEATRRLFEELLNEARKSHPVRHAVARSYVEVLLLKARESQAGTARSSSRSMETLRRCQQLIDEQFATLHGLDDLSRAARLAPSHICRLFRRFQQGSPHTCLVRRKLDHAAKVLATQPVMVKEAAAAVGYDDALHFSRVFRRHFGCSPRQFQTSRSGARNTPAAPLAS